MFSSWGVRSQCPPALPRPLLPLKANPPMGHSGAEPHERGVLPQDCGHGEGVSGHDLPPEQPHHTLQTALPAAAPPAVPARLDLEWIWREIGVKPE